MSNESQKAISLINERITVVERHQQSDNENCDLSITDKRLNSNYYRGALNELYRLRNKLESELTWRDRV